MNIKKMLIGVATVLALTACGPTAPSTDSSNSTPDSSTTESAVETRPFLANIFGENSKYGELVEVSNTEYAAVKGYYEAKDANGTLLGRVFVAQGENQFGIIKLSVGITADGKIGKIFLIENTQSFGDKVQSEYVDKYNKGEIGLDDVTCGATFGATLVKELSTQSLNYFKYEINGETPDITDYKEYCKKVFGSEAIYEEHFEVKDPANENIVEYWNAQDKGFEYIGRVYHLSLEGPHAVMHLIVGSKKDGSLEKVILVNKAPGEYGDIAEKYAEDLSNGTVGLDDEIKTGATGTCTSIRDLTKQALAHAKANPFYQDLCAYVFPEGTKFVNFENINDATNENIKNAWVATDVFGINLGRAYHLALPGKHAIMHLIVGVKLDGTFKIYLANKAPNEYGKIAEKYAEDLSNGTVGLDDEIKTGATGTCTGINQLVKQALAHYNAHKLTEVEGFLALSFGEAAKYVEYTVITDEVNVNLKESWLAKDAQDKVLGRVYHAALPGKHAVMHLLVAVKVDGSLAKIVLVNSAPNEYGKIAEKYAEDLSNGTVGLDDEIKTGATGTCTGIRDLTKQALAHYNANKIVIA